MKEEKKKNIALFPGNRLLNSEDVCKAMGVKPSTLANWVSEKKIPHVKLGSGKKSMLKFDPHRLNEWLAEHSHEPIDLSSFTIY